MMVQDQQQPPAQPANIYSDLPADSYQTSYANIQAAGTNINNNTNNNNNNGGSMAININTLIQQHQQQQEQKEQQKDHHLNYAPLQTANTPLQTANNNNTITNNAVVGANSYDPELIIKEVWSTNLYEEFSTIRALISRFKFISLLTEIPGIIARPMGKFLSVSDYHYQTMRVNSDISDMIQLSISLCDSNGKKPTDFNPKLPSTWQFNFKFDLNQEMFSSEVIKNLRLTGINFEAFEKNGIEYHEFAELMIDSGLILNPLTDVTWISFNCGYDFGFLSSLLINKLMPLEGDEFLSLCNEFFINFYDIKYIALRQTNLFPNLNTYTNGYNDGMDNNDNNFNNTGNSNAVNAYALSNNGNISGNSGMNNSNNNNTNDPPFKRFNLDNLADNLGIPKQQASHLQSGNQSLLTSICFFELKRLLALRGPSKDMNKLAGFKNLIWGIDKAPELVNIPVSNGTPVPIHPGLSTPLQHAVSINMNQNSPMYLNR